MKTFQVAMNFLALCLSFKMMAIAKSTSRRNMETPGEPGERTRTLQGGQCIGIAPSSCSQLFGYTTCSSCTTSRACVDLAEACQNACNIHPGCSCDVDLGTCSFGTDNEYRCSGTPGQCSDLTTPASCLNAIGCTWQSASSPSSPPTTPTSPPTTPPTSPPTRASQPTTGPNEGGGQVTGFRCEFRYLV